MRVVAGLARGRRLVAPEGHDVRPTTDRVREATFNALGSLGVLDDAVVLDLFAGSGALGVEALSRGAAHARFVDRLALSLAAVRTNLATTGLADRAEVVLDDAFGHLARSGEPVDLVLCDPPYEFDAWAALFDAFPASWGEIVVVAESDRPIEVGAPWDVLREKRYGTSVVTIVRRTADEP